MKRNQEILEKVVDGLAQITEIVCQGHQFFNNARPTRMTTSKLCFYHYITHMKLKNIGLSSEWIISWISLIQLKFADICFHEIWRKYQKMLWVMKLINKWTREQVGYALTIIMIAQRFNEIKVCVEPFSLAIGWWRVNKLTIRSSWNVFCLVFFGGGGINFQLFFD